MAEPPARRPPGLRLAVGRQEAHVAAELLDFAVDSVQYRVFAPPVDHGPTLERSAVLERMGQRLSLPFGAVYLIHARKQQGTITPVRSLRWRAPRLPSVVLPATRSRNPTIH